METDEPEAKRLRLRYAGTCTVCETDLPARTTAIYDRGSRTVRCLDCGPTGNLADPVVVDVREGSPPPQLVQSLPPSEIGEPGDTSEVLRELRDGGASLRAAEMTLTGLTSLTTPTHDFVTASRELFATLQHVREMAPDNAPALDTPAALTSLAHGCALEAELVTAARGVPASLLHCHLLFAPARTLKPTVERLEARGKGRFIPVELTDAPDLAWRWETAARRTPEVAAAVRCLDLTRSAADRDHGMELGR